MKKILFTLFLLLLISSLSACSKDNPVAQESASLGDSQEAKTKFLAEYQKADWLNPLDEIVWNELEEDNDNYAYQFQSEEGFTRSLSYEKTASDEYSGVLKITFTDDNTHVIEIPKSFATHIDQLNFSSEPSQIINPDPIVEFANTREEIEIKSLETKSADEIKASLEEQIIDTEMKNCEKLGDKAMACTLSLISKYRDSAYVKSELYNLNMAELAGGVAQAVLQSSLGKCEYVDDNNDQARCYEYAYQTLMRDCDALSDRAYRDCVRDLSSDLPSYKEQRLFCGYIKDEAMRAECEGTAPMEVCDEIENEEQKNLCKINIVRTSNDVSACENIDSPDYRQVCLAVVGVNLNDLSLCKQIEDDYLQGLCQQKSAIQKNDLSICNNIKDVEVRDICLGTFLTKKEAITEELCASFHELFLKETCQLALAVLGNKPERCADTSLISPDNQVYCYFGIAVKYGSPSACQRIRSYNEIDQDAVEKLKEDCLKIVKENFNTTEETEVTEDNTTNNEASLSEANVPAAPDWLNCPVPDYELELKVLNDHNGSRYYYWDNNNNRKVGPYLTWSNPDFNLPLKFECYGDDGLRQGVFKNWEKDSTELSLEGTFKDDKYEGLITKYVDGLLREKTTYSADRRNGPYTRYCIDENDKCNIGDIQETGFYTDNQQTGTWTFYRYGEVHYSVERD